MNKLFFLLFTSFLLTGCRQFNLTMTTPEQYRSLDSSNVTIAAKDSILIIHNNNYSAVWKKVFMPEITVPRQIVRNDTIFYKSSQISVALPFKSISTIKCRGVWNEEVGFISEI